MQTLSRREEADILERGKKDALKACDAVVQEFTDCARGRTVSVLWSCHGRLNAMKGCMRDYLNLERIDEMKRDYILHRDDRKQEAIWKAEHPERK